MATTNVVNEALFSFIRTTTVAVPGNYITACAVGIVPPLANGSCSNIPSSNNINPIQLQIPTITISGLPLLAHRAGRLRDRRAEHGRKLFLLGHELLQHV